MVQDAVVFMFMQVRLVTGHLSKSDGGLWTVVEATFENAWRYRQSRIEQNRYGIAVKAGILTGQ